MNVFTGKSEAAPKPGPSDTAVDNLKGVKHKLIVMSGKGGVGKSTVAVNLAFSLAAKGKTVGILDADIHGPSVPKLLGVPNMPLMTNESGKIVPMAISPSIRVISMAFLLRDKDSPVIWRGPLKMSVLKQFIEDVAWGDIDYLVVDLPPGTGDEPLSIAQLIPDVDGAVIVTTPQDVALLSVRKSINFAKAVGLKPIGLVENMSGMKCPHCGKDIDVFAGGAVEKASKEYGLRVLGKIPMSLDIARSGDAGEPFASEKDDGESGLFNAITDQIIGIVESGS